MATYSLLRKCRRALVSPASLFQAARHEKGIRQALIFGTLTSFGMASFAVMVHLFKIASPYSVIFNIYQVVLLTPYKLLTRFGMPDSAATMLLVFWALGIAAGFVAAGALQLFARLFGGKQGYAETYKTVAYASLPSVFSWLPYIGLLFNAWTLVLRARGLATFHGMTRNKAAAAVLLAFVAVYTFVIVFFISALALSRAV